MKLLRNGFNSRNSACKLGGQPAAGKFLVKFAAAKAHIVARRPFVFERVGHNADPLGDADRDDFRLAANVRRARLRRARIRRRGRFLFAFGREPARIGRDASARMRVRIPVLQQAAFAEPLFQLGALRRVRVRRRRVGQSQEQRRDLGASELAFGERVGDDFSRRACLLRRSGGRRRGKDRLRFRQRQRRRARLEARAAQPRDPSDPRPDRVTFHGARREAIERRLRPLSLDACRALGSFVIDARERIKREHLSTNYANSPCALLRSGGLARRRRHALLWPVFLCRRAARQQAGDQRLGGVRAGDRDRFDARPVRRAAGDDEIADRALGAAQPARARDAVDRAVAGEVVARVGDRARLRAMDDVRRRGRAARSRRRRSSRRRARASSLRIRARSATPSSRRRPRRGTRRALRRWSSA